MLATACGDDSGTKSDSNTGPQDAPIDMPAIDAPALPSCTPVNGTNVSVRPVTQITGEGGALIVTSPPNDGRLFVVMQSGKIMIVENEQVRPTPFLDISNTNLTAGDGEQGLLGLAFHPNYAGTRELYVFYTTNFADIVARFRADPSDPYKVESNTAEIILSIPDFAPNHNGGMLEFGKDGYLYISTGDGGGGGDPRLNGQALDRSAQSCTQSQCEPLLGKILRIDVSGSAGVKNYKIPADNPFATSGGEPEIYVIGLRNPWRFAFDKETGDMWIGDVGQGQPRSNGYEEINYLPAGQIAGKNLGWSMWEGVETGGTISHCYGNYTCTTTGMTFPPIERDHVVDQFLAIVGGDVYRGPCYPDLVGTYFFADNNKSQLSKATVSNGTVTATDLTPPATTQWPERIASIHKDARGELYLTTASPVAADNGRVYHIEAGP